MESKTVNPPTQGSVLGQCPTSLPQSTLHKWSLWWSVPGKKSDRTKDPHKPESTRQPTSTGSRSDVPGKVSRRTLCIPSNTLGPQPPSPLSVSLSLLKIKVSESAGLEWKSSETPNQRSVILCSSPVRSGTRVLPSYEPR